MNLKDLTDEELLVFGAEVNATNDQNLVDKITDELKARNKRHKCHNYLDYAIEVLEWNLDEVTTLAGNNPEYLLRIRSLKQAIKILKESEE